MHRFLTVFEEETTGNAALMSNAEMGNMLSFLLLVMLLACGVYALYSYFRLRRTCELFPNKFMYPGNCPPENCIDVDGFIDYIQPRLFLLGAAMIVCGIAYAVYSLVLQKSILWADIAAIVIPAGVFVWYMFVQRKAAKEFW